MSCNSTLNASKFEGFELNVKYREDDETTVVPLTGHTAFFSLVGTDVDGNDVAITYSSDGTEISLDAANGEFDIAITPAEVQAYNFKSVTYTAYVQQTGVPPVVLGKGIFAVEA